MRRLCAIFGLLLFPVVLPKCVGQERVAQESVAKASEKPKGEKPAVEKPTGEGQGKLSISPATATLVPGAKKTFTLSGAPKDAKINWRLSPVAGSNPDPGTINEKGEYTAPSSNGTLNVYGTVKVIATIENTDNSATATVTLIGSESPWEARSIVGVQQSAASASASKLTYFLDFFIERPIGNNPDPRQLKFNIWGDVRLASVPQQLNMPVTQFVSSAGSTAGKVNVNQLVQSAEFTSGVEWRFITSNPGDKVRTVGVVAEFGATGPINPVESVSTIYNIPTGDMLKEFQQYYGTFPDISPSQTVYKYVAFVAPDRQQFYKRYGVGFRVTTFGRKLSGEAPGMYTVTVGQDELITGGRFHSVVGHFDVFYPLPIDIGGFKFLYLFGTASMRLSKAKSAPALVLQPATGSGVPTFPDPSIAVFSAPSTRDVYRLGVGIDLMNVLSKIKITTQ